MRCVSFGRATAKRKGVTVNKIDMGAKDGQGLRSVSVLRNELKPILGDTVIIENLYYGNYALVDEVTIGACAVEKLIKIGDKDISNLANQLPRKLANQAK